MKNLDRLYLRTAEGFFYEGGNNLLIYIIYCVKRVLK